MSERYFSETPLAIGRHIPVTGPEAHHLIHVMRASVGQSLSWFDGSGCEFQAIIQEMRRADLVIEVVAQEEKSVELSQRVLIASAVPKGDRLRFLVEKLTELGAAAYLPIITQRSINPLNAGLESKIDRWIIEASKQCQRNRLMQRLRPIKLIDLLGDCAAIGQRWIAVAPADDCAVAAPGSNADRPSAEPLPGTAPMPGEATFVGGDVGTDAGTGLASMFDRIILVGPEGGFSEREIEQALAAGFQALPMGRTVLRIETAAIAAMALSISDRR